MDGLLILSSSDIDEIPELYKNESIIELLLDNNNISNIWDNSFPPNLLKLNLSFNKILSDGLPFYWPSVLKEINLDNNNIYNIDDLIEWPLTLEILHLSNNPLTKIPLCLPPSLKELHIANTQIEIIENIPSSCEFINTSHSHICYIDKLPDSLTTLYLSDNRIDIDGLPIEWPKNLLVLELSHNFIDTFPFNLPDSLHYINLSSNYIQYIPKRLPFNISVCLLQHNKIKSCVIELVVRQQIIQLNLKNNQLTELPTCLVNKVSSNILSYSIQDNWNDDIHHTVSNKMKKIFRLYKMKKIRMKWLQTRYIREELLEVAMSPNRWPNFL